MARRPVQLELARTGGWGGRRAGAGRKRVASRPLVPHRPRAPHVGWAPVHLTLRSMAGLPSLRSMEVFPAVVAALRVSQGARFRVLHFSVQDNHVHLLVEADDSAALRKGARSLGVRLARAINRACGRKGRVLDDRYHTRALRTPREVRFALAYVLFNFKKHQVRVPTRLDPCSSAPWCDGFRDRRGAALDGDALEGAPIASARTWLARVGWRRHGLLSPDEAPAEGP
ncbi:MAG: transposase [Myxococcales bacterium]|nr:transposase [Myxococcales bacterium]